MSRAKRDSGFAAMAEPKPAPAPKPQTPATPKPKVAPVAVPNESGVKMVAYQKTNAQPKRKRVGIYLQERVWKDMVNLTTEQKLSAGRNAPEIWEEAIRDLVEKYKSQQV